MNKYIPKNCGIMFHHFHSKKYTKSDGSISRKDFISILTKININKITSSENFLINKKNICLTFDDSLKCQYDIAFPILKKLNIKAFWFIYSSLNPNKYNIELFRKFRNTKYKKFDNFYMDFLKLLKNKKDVDLFLTNNKKNIKKIKKEYSFYSINEIKFRFIRDKFLKQNQYNKIIQKMYKNKNFDFKKEIKNIFLSKKEIKDLSNDGQIIGLHSHNHPTKISLLKKKDQYNEYITNKKILEKIIKKKITVSSHPSGDYNLQTLQILKKIGITHSFRSNIKIDKKFTNSSFRNLVIPREDHINLLK